MSLEGTFETIALPHVLSLLSVTCQTGELRVEAGGEVISVWLERGRLAGFDAGAHKTALDALFALLLLEDASFLFHTGTEPVNPMAPADLIPLLEEVDRRLAEWPSIMATVPSQSCRVALEASFDGPVMLRADQWQMVATIGSGRPVGAVLTERGLGEFDGRKAVKELVDLGLVKVCQTAGETAGGPTVHPAKRRARGRAGAKVVPAGTKATVSAAVCFEDDEPLPVALTVPVTVSRGQGGTSSLVEPGPGEPQHEADVASLGNQPVDQRLLLEFLASARD